MSVTERVWTAVETSSRKTNNQASFGGSFFKYNMGVGLIWARLCAIHSTADPVVGRREQSAP